MEPLILNMGGSRTQQLVMEPAAEFSMVLPNAAGGNVQVIVDTTANWATKTTFIPRTGEIIVYSDRNVIGGVNYPGVKIGDGLTFVVDLPFLGDDIAGQIIGVLNAHIANSSIHVTPAEKEYWNNKLDSGVTGETLVLAPAMLSI